MRVLFSVQRASFLKNFDSVVVELAQHGHEVLVAIEQPEGYISGQDALLEELAATPGVTIEPGPPGAAGTGVRLRTVLDYWEYLAPQFPRHYTRAWGQRAPRPARVVGQWPLARRVAGAALAAAEASIRPSPDLVRYLRERRPDVLLLSPHIFPGSTQPDLLRAAKAIGVPAGVCVHSWDNLSSKGRIRLRPDRVLVWNNLQLDEARRFHRLPEELACVTGAQAYDWWFDWSPSPREVFLARVGLDPARPVVLYACSASWTGRVDVDFVLPWIDAVRRQLPDVGILIRPHPKRVESWPELDVSKHENVAIWPRSPELPGGRSTRSDYFDSMYHSTALVGVNTSAMIEAAILGKPVLTLSLPEFAEEQEGTLHFRYLSEIAGGLLVCASSLDEHVGQLAAAVADPEAAAARAHAFTEVFVRPFGLNEPAAPRFVAEVERLAALRPEPARSGAALAVRPLVAAGTGAYIAARAVWRGAKALRA